MSVATGDGAPGYGKDGPMFIVSGKVSSVIVERSSLNLLTKMQSKAALASAMASIADTGNAASAASLALYDGEDVENIGCELNGRIVVGSNFQDWAIKDGDEVRMVVSRLKENVLFAHAAVRMEDTWLWLPYAANEGRQVAMRACLRLGAWGWLWGVVLMAGIGLFQVPVGLVLLFGIGLIAVGFALLFGLLSMLAYYDGRPRVLYAERIFKVMGFKRPEIVNLKPFSTRAMFKAGESASMSVYRLREALAFYNPPSNRQTPTAPVSAAPFAGAPAPPPRFVRPMKKQDGDDSGA